MAHTGMPEPVVDSGHLDRYVLSNEQSGRRPQGLGRQRLGKLTTLPTIGLVSGRHLSCGR